MRRDTEGYLAPDLAPETASEPEPERDTHTAGTESRGPGSESESGAQPVPEPGKYRPGLGPESGLAAPDSRPTAAGAHTSAGRVARHHRDPGRCSCWPWRGRGRWGGDAAAAAEIPGRGDAAPRHAGDRDGFAPRRHMAAAAVAEDAEGAEGAAAAERGVRTAPEVDTHCRRRSTAAAAAAAARCTTWRLQSSSSTVVRTQSGDGQMSGRAKFSVGLGDKCDEKGGSASFNLLQVCGWV